MSSVEAQRTADVDDIKLAAILKVTDNKNIFTLNPYKKKLKARPKTSIKL